MPGAFCSACGAPLPRSVAAMVQVEPASPAASEATDAPSSSGDHPAGPAPAPVTAADVAAPPIAPAPSPPVPGSPWERGTPNPLAVNPMAMNPIAMNPAGADSTGGTTAGPRPLAFPMPGLGSAPTAAPTLPPSQVKVISRHSVLGKVVGAVASVGIILGALFDWASTSNAFKVPAMFLFDMHTRSRDPKIGFVLFGIGILGVIVSFVTSRGVRRVLLGGVAVVIAGLFCVQIQRAISDTPLGRGMSLTDVIGGGVWLTALAGIVLALSPLLDRASFG
jgi:hypothetical protein